MQNNFEKRNVSKLIFTIYKAMTNTYLTYVQHTSFYLAHLPRKIPVCGSVLKNEIPLHWRHR